jgi:hypothetical protein
MERTFVRYADKREQREVVYPADLIWKVEVHWWGTNENGVPVRVRSLRAGESPTAYRVYRVFVGTEFFDVPSNSPSKALDLIEQIYRTSLPFDESPTTEG